MQLAFITHIFTSFIKYVFNIFIKISPADRRRPGDVHWMSPKGPNIRHTQGTYKELLGDQQKYWRFDEENCFLDAVVFVLHIYYCLLLEKQISTSSKWGRPRDFYGPQLQDVLETKWWDVLGTSVIYVF